MHNQKKAYIFAALTVMLWSTVASAFKLSLRHLNYLELLFWASLFSSLALFGVLSLQGRLKVLFSYSKKQYLASLGLGLLNPFLYYIILFKAYDLLPAQEAQPLNYTWAITLALLSIPLLRQKIGLRDLGGALVSYLGVVVISTHGNLTSFSFSDPLGVGLALLSTIVWSLYWIYNTKDTRDPVAGLLLNFLFSLPFTFLAVLLFTDFSLPGVYGLLGAAYVGLFEMGITFVLWLYALKYSENTAKVGSLIFVSPFVSLVLIHFLVGEKILGSTFVGLILIVAGLIIQKTKKAA
jgi:drug/metabolite transporter (DMT)-like permease